MEFLEVIRKRRTTNGPFLDKPVSREHQHLLMEAASRAPSHFNSQPWRFILIEDRAKREKIAEIGGRTMQQLIADGQFFERYRPYFRFSEKELEERGDGILIDQLPGPLRPFTKHIMSPSALGLLRTLRVPQTLGEDNRKLVAGSPLLLAALLDKAEYRPGELSGFYSVLGLGMAIENIWLTTVELGMGIQFVSTPMEIPEAWAELKRLLEVPEHLELMAIYRLGYVPPEKPRPRIDWRSDHRKRLSQYVFRDSCATPESDP
ncbi:MAG: nitroreductase family protein [Meiothermus sp.]|uniref:nitroreductase family protein n=1 Tax=Meiothermus sp. TaxID=1955249 RepID=UPI0025F78680|nr:nitroreductase family protein [Meiothermus sp.]MCS7069542.1 nitroreductase family protein [Meiothermus sp.]MCX7601598.1 nitroreductase family protein [Meiothermus sp.]MDW8426067.1 nitroreductase family protein [Meiothermus sp.]